MFEPRTLYRVVCDAPGCIRTVMNDEYDTPLLVTDAQVDQIPQGYATDDEGAPWVLWAERNRIMCPAHGHLLEAEKHIAATHEPLFGETT